MTPKPPAEPTAGQPRHASRADSEVPPAPWASLTTRWPWAVFVLPFVVYMVAGSFEPGPDAPTNLVVASIPYAAYPVVYMIKILLVMVTMALVWPGYRQFPLRVSPLAVAVGAVGVVVWIGLCKLNLERDVLGPLGLNRVLDLGARSGFNPLAQWPDEPVLAYGFLAVRFWGLAVIVPVIEEFFLRGFVMRYFVRPEWWEVPFGTLTGGALLAGTLVPVLLHPAEIVAALAWFSLVTWLMWRTRNMWDCVVAHMVTNLLLGAWVVYSGDWYFM